MKTAIIVTLFSYCVATVVQAEDVPGCNCPAATCDSWLSDDLTTSPTNNLALCPVGLRSDSFVTNIDHFENITNQSQLSFCDAVDADLTFQATYGSEAGYRQISTDADYGDYLELPSAFVFGVMGLGTCEDAIAAQSSCGTTEEPFSAQVLGLSGGLGTALFLPYSNYSDVPQVNIISCCLGSDDDSHLSPIHGLGIYMQVGTGEDLSYTSRQVGCPYASSRSTISPFLTHLDWVEPAPGRRYMCKEFAASNADSSATNQDLETYYMFVVSLGNEPCRGQAISDETEPPTPFSSGAIHSLRFKTVSSAVALLLIVLKLV